MYYYILLIFLYFAVGAVFAAFNCAIQDDTQFPPNMSEEDKNMFALIVAFWAILLPVKFVRRLYKAIRTSLEKDKND